MKFAMPAFLVSCALASTGVWAQAPAGTPPDNTKTNAQPKNHEIKSSTADSQSNSQSDLKTTQAIRKSVIADKTLSTSAHNVKIVTVQGKVTLNGVVKNDQEKSAIEEKAQAVVGKTSVVNDLKVAP